MRKAAVLIAVITLLVAATAGTAVAMQPPGEPAQGNFGCVDGSDGPVGGHPGAAGIVDAATRVGGLTDDPTPTAWNAVEYADPIDFGSC